MDQTPRKGEDYEYDEAHDALAAPPSEPPPGDRPVPPPPRVELGEGGDYGHDEARDFAR